MRRETEAPFFFFFETRETETTVLWSVLETLVSFVSVRDKMNIFFYS